MSENNDPHLAELRAALADAAKIDDLAERTLEVVAVVDEVASPLGIHPVVVGGMAVYFWTENEAFVTYDIDVVMAVTDRLRATLADLGFEMSRDRRHWRLAGSEVFLEAPSADLDTDAVVTEVTLPSGRTARLLSHIDILLDRLAEFQATGHLIVAQQILVLLNHLTEEEASELRLRAASRRVVHALDAMSRLADEIAAGRKPPESDELHEIARAAQRAEYTQKQP
ncbi:hypothetical protein [Conexibacter woesei]|uniref:Uncharacterized protein n=1 Tax=Conexibacter woesei (strain DSM 14684 / CCUG 47730 / CIP 108061 / JCM 11494 / NBRC 100937 / ID131577) TaxID=469383 RepID=D3F3F6_CONWI|nr:hypothetical protein [Conexibacter woesei]ADB52321.1 hypothetical protein Cwoe_3904 [Conexibacter woesei DSM 14684]